MVIVLPPLFKIQTHQYMARKGEKIIREASAEDEKALLAVTGNSADIVYVRGHKYKVKWLHPAIGDWVSALMSKDGNDSKILSQSAALIVLNGFWRCHMFYWLLWRWFYYIRQYNAMELTPLFEMAQKKTAQQEAPAYLNATILLTALSTTRKQMTKAEAERTLRELRTDKDGSSQRSTESTQAPSSSSASPSAG